jgi:hypothetical protein
MLRSGLKGAIAGLLLISGGPGVSAESSSNGFDLADALIPVAEIRRGGPPRDGIPAIYTPKFVKPADAKRLSADDRVLGTFVDGVAKAFPIEILDHHEVVNDWTAPTHMVVTYCPLCGSGMAFKTPDAGQAVFGVSGLLYNSDVLLYDHDTESLWSQVLGRAISGPKAGARLEQIPLIHTSYGQWRSRHPDTWILSRDTGYRGVPYGRSPYRGYERSSRLWFPVAARDSRYPAKAWVLGITLDGVNRAYPFVELAKTGGEIVDEVAGRRLLIYYRDGAAWAEDAGGELIPTIRLFWFAWYAFHPDTEVFVAPD